MCVLLAGCGRVGFELKEPTTDAPEEQTIAPIPQTTDARFVPTSAGDDLPRCRFDPDCETGGIGALCTTNDDCSVGECCLDEKNCGGGMCLLPCTTATDCPSDMHCAHSYCFFTCEQGSDCAEGMGCFHKNPPFVCEWG